MVYIIALLAVVFLGLAALVVSRMAGIVKSASAPVDEGRIGTSNKVNGALFLAFWCLVLLVQCGLFCTPVSSFYQRHHRPMVVGQIHCFGSQWVSLRWLLY